MCCAKVGPVNGALELRAGEVQLLALWAVDLDGGVAWDVRGPHWQAELAVAVHARAAAKIAVLVLFKHGGEATGGDYVPVGWMHITFVDGLNCPTAECEPPSGK